MTLDVPALADYIRRWQRAARLGREPAPVESAVEVDGQQVRWRRMAVTHATERLPAGRYAEAAFGGLQDSAPRSGQLSLHARVEGVQPGAWEDPSLAQVWLRWSDYVVPRADVGVFTLGAFPRDRRHAEAIDRLTDAILELTVDGRRDGREVATALPELPHPTWIRASGVSGRVLIRWDTRTTEVVAIERTGTEPEEARVELARRFLHWYGPAGPQHLAKWAGLTREDGEASWRALEPELVPVSLAGRGRWMLRADRDELARVERPEGVRLLPSGDPCLFMVDPGRDAANAAPTRQPDPDAGITSRVINSLTGRISLDGEIVGAWGRSGAQVTLDAWPQLPRHRRAEVEAAAEGLAGPIGAPIKLRWLP